MLRIVWGMARRALGAEQSAEQIGLRLKALRLALGFEKAKEFAETFGASPQQLSNYENGENRPDVWQMIHMAMAHPGVSLDWIYLGRPDAMSYDLAKKTLERLESLTSTPDGISNPS